MTACNPNPQGLIIVEIDNMRAWQIAGFGEEYFATPENGKSDKPRMKEYKSVLNSKQTKDNLVRRRNNKFMSLFEISLSKNSF